MDYVDKGIKSARTHKAVNSETFVLAGWSAALRELLDKYDVAIIEDLPESDVKEFILQSGRYAVLAASRLFS